jgi:hypothetical protein
MTKTKSTRKSITTRPLTLATFGHVTGGMNKADLTEQLAFCDDMTIATFRR